MPVPMVERHLHWKFVACDGPEPTIEKPGMQWAISIEVVGYADEASALIAARNVVTRDVYHLSGVYECSRCGFENQYASDLGKLVKAASS